MAIIEEIERRLLNWARWKAGELRGGLGYAAVDFNNAAGGGRDGYHEAVIPIIGPEANETDQAVSALASQLKATVELWYLSNRTLTEKARRLGVHAETVKRRRWQAHAVIQHWLSDRAVSRRQSLTR